MPEQLVVAHRSDGSIGAVRLSTEASGSLIGAPSTSSVCAATNLIHQGHMLTELDRESAFTHLRFVKNSQGGQYRYKYRVSGRAAVGFERCQKVRNFGPHKWCVFHEDGTRVAHVSASVLPLGRADRTFAAVHSSS